MKAVVLPPLSAVAPGDLAARLPGWEVVVVDEQAGVAAALADADAVIVQLLEADAARAAGRLALCQVFSAGWDGVAVDAVRPEAWVCNSGGHEVALGEHVLGVSLMLARRLGERDRTLRAGRFDQLVGEGAGRGFDGFDTDLAGRVAGIIGMGTIGLRCAELFRALGMRVVGVARTPSPQRAAAAGLEWLGGPSREDLRELLRRSDLAVVAVPREAATEGLIGAAELEALGPRGLLVNVARGPVVQERPLYEALRDGRIAGAAIDVWWRYPPAGEKEFRPHTQPFHELENVVLTPHTAGLSQSNFRSRWDFAVRQLRAFEHGEPLENVIRPAAGRAA